MSMSGMPNIACLFPGILKNLHILTPLRKAFVVYKLHILGGAWYGLLSGFTCSENMPLKQPIPVNTSLNFL